MMKKLLVLVLVALALNSCKKELLVKHEVSINPPAPKIDKTDISFNDFLGQINVNSLGILKAKFTNSSPTTKLSTVNNGNPLKKLSIYTDSVQKFSTDKGTSYVFRMELTSKRAVTFRNFTFFVDKQGKTSAFIAAYTPNRKWIEAKMHKINIPYEGDVIFTPVNLESGEFAHIVQQNNEGSSTGKIMGTGNKTMTTSQVCHTFSQFDYGWIACSSGYHGEGNWEECDFWSRPNEGTPPHQGFMEKQVNVCYTMDDGGSSGGGGGGTSPNPPDGYDPCEDGGGDSSTCDDSSSPGTQLPTQIQSLINLLGLSQADAVYVAENQNFGLELYAVLEEDEFSAEGIIAANMTVRAVSNGVLATSNTNLYHAFTWANTDGFYPFDPMTFRVYHAMQCGIIRVEHPEYSDWRVHWEASKEMTIFSWMVLA
ncbi:hypothetical protein [Pedobacter sp. UC225_65]|uniref:hypothetical protein n=1 Tax=Pedobacter sp. UC225_65 TaxID=3350173 RepID=UPI003672DA0B